MRLMLAFISSSSRLRSSRSDRRCSSSELSLAFVDPMKAIHPPNQPKIALITNAPKFHSHANAPIPSELDVLMSRRRDRKEFAAVLRAPVVGQHVPRDGAFHPPCTDEGARLIVA